MAGIIVQLIISWLLVWLFERNDLRVLGLYPSGKKIVDFFVFLLVTAFFCSLTFTTKMYFGKQQWEVNPAFSFQLLLEGIRWNIQSVIYEELIFRGVLLFILIQRLGTKKGIILSAIAFGIYHWFSFGVIGNIPGMLTTFFITGLMGLLLAYGYAKTMSLYIPIAIHLGWNFTQNFVFSSGPIGIGIFREVSPHSFKTNSYAVAFLVFILPLAGALVVNYFLIKRKKQVPVTIYDKTKLAASDDLAS